MSEQFAPDDVIPHGEAIVERFGGIRPMASKLNVPVTTVQGWKKRDAIPAIRRDEILSAAAHYDIDLKGLMPVANQNTRPVSGIAEDPALTAARVAPQPQQAPVQQAQQQQQQPRPAQPAQQAQAQTVPPQRRFDTQGYTSGADLRQVRSAARRTSFWTTAGLVAVVAAAGFMLFGQQGPAETQRIQSLESRLNVVEQRAQGTTPTDDAGVSAQISNLRAVIGASTEGLTEMARGVMDGNAPILQRLAVIEQQLTQRTGSPAGALSGMAQRMEGMAQGALGSAGTGEWQSAVADLRQLVTGLQGQMGGLEGALQQAKEDDSALGRQLQDVSSRDLGAAAMLLALTELRDSINRQTPFADDLALLRQVATGTDPELAASVDRLAPYAETGVLSASGLKRELQGSANDIITAKLRGEDVSVKEKVVGRLQGLFSVQKDGEMVTGGAEQDVIRRASAQLDQNDVAGAMATLKQLDGEAAVAAQPWEAKAAATLAAQALDGQLVNAITSKIRSGLETMKGGAGGGVGGIAGAAPINMNPGMSVTPSIPQVPGVMTPNGPAISGPAGSADPVPPATVPPAVNPPVQAQPQPAPTIPAPTVIIQQ